MHAVTAKLPDDLYERLENLGKMIDRKKSYLIRKAVEGFLEEREDYFIALHRLVSMSIKSVPVKITKSVPVVIKNIISY